MKQLSLASPPKNNQFKNYIIKKSVYLASNYVIPRLKDETIINLSEKINNFKAPAGKIFFDHIFVNLKRKLPSLSKNVKKKILDNFISNFLLLSGD
ncbi:MAG: hypothetical protein ACYDDE_08620, partial [bacterium]